VDDITANETQTPAARHSAHDHHAKPQTNGHAPGAFDLSSLAYADTGELVIVHPLTGEPTGWKWIIAGPGHPIVVEQGDEFARQAIRDRKARESAQVNSRKWKPDDESPEENRKRNARYFARRVLGWVPDQPVRLESGAAPVEFSTDNVAGLLRQPKFGWLYKQVADYCSEDVGFIQRSEKD
jgi:hypothetical protein